MMNANYLQSLSRFAQSITGELNNKLAGNIKMDLRPVVDPAGDAYAANILNLQNNGALAANQATWLLQQAGYLPEDLPASNGTAKGGDNDDGNPDQG